MIKRVFWNESVIALFVGAGQLRLYQPHYRRNILLSTKDMELVDVLASAGTKGLRVDQIPSSRVRIRDATKFSLFDHAYANSDMFDRDAEPLGAGDELDVGETLEILMEAGMVSTSLPVEYDHKKRTFGEQFKGSFYEQIGTECLMNRVQPTEWWTKQKFETDLRNTRETPYRFIQDRFLDTYLKETISNLTVCDIGCGTGYYTNRMAKYAREVVGLDYNPDYVGFARDLWPGVEGGGPRFSVCDIIDMKAEEPALVERKYDRVVLIDTLLFMFHESYQPQLYANRHQVLKNVRSLVEEEGRVIVMDPNPLWLTPWFGSDERPFGILDSYSSHHFKVAPTLEEVTELFDACGLAVRRVIGPKPSKELLAKDSGAYHFYREAPPWWLYELQAV